MCRGRWSICLRIDFVLGGVGGARGVDLKRMSLVWWRIPLLHSNFLNHESKYLMVAWSVSWLS